MRLEFGHADASGRQRPLFTSWPSSSCRLSSRTSWHPSSSPLPSSPCCPPSLSEWRDQTVQARIAMHCGQLLQRNEENRESSEKRVDTGNADQTGVAAPRRVGGEVERAPRDASARAHEENSGVEEILISCGFLACRKILLRPLRRACDVRCTASSDAGRRLPGGCGQSKKKRRENRARKARRPRHSLSSARISCRRFGPAAAVATSLTRGQHLRRRGRGALNTKAGETTTTSSRATQPRDRQRSSLRRSSSLTTCGLALPADAFIA
jgi:hypothetical protein